MHIASDSIRHRLHVRRNEHVLSFFHRLMCLSTCCILPSNETQAHVKPQTKHSHDHSHNIQFSSSHVSTAIVRALRITKAEAAPPRRPHTKEPSKLSKPTASAPGVSSFKVTSHHRPFTRGSRTTRILENARPSGERNKRGFSSRRRNLSDERLESGCLRMTALRNDYWLVNGDGLGGDRAIGTGRTCL
jgi:hypothetical protein